MMYVFKKLKNQCYILVLHRDLLSPHFDGKKTQTRLVCVEVLRPSQPNGVMSSVVSLPNHMFTGQA